MSMVNNHLYMLACQQATEPRVCIMDTMKLHPFHLKTRKLKFSNRMPIQVNQSWPARMKVMYFSDSRIPHQQANGSLKHKRKRQHKSLSATSQRKDSRA